MAAKDNSQQILRIKELDPDMIAPSTKNMNNTTQGGSKIVIIGKPGCFIKGTPVLMWNGSIKNVEDVIVGDQVMGDDSTVRNVLELCTGKEKMYKISPDDMNDCGKEYIVNERHKLVLKNINTQEIVEIKVKDYLSKSEEWKSYHFLYRNTVNFPEKEVKNSFDFGKELAICIKMDKEKGNKDIKNIPSEYRINSKNNQREFLRGFFSVIPNYEEINEKSIKDDIDFMKKCIGSYYENMIVPFRVTYQNVDDYYGFTLDGNHRFLLGSLDVVRNTGKTTLITSLLHEKSHIFPVGEVMSGTEDSNGHYGKIFPSSFVYNALDKSRINDFVERQKLAKKHLPNPWAILLLDDCTDDPKLFNDPLFQGIFKNGRHWKMLFILSLQYSLDIKPVIRTNVDGTFILRETNMKNRKSLWENYAGIFPDFTMFCDVLDQLTDDYTALYVHNATQSNKLEDCVFWYKAKPIPPNFRIGCDEYWLFHDERYDKERNDS